MLIGKTWFVWRPLAILSACEKENTTLHTITNGKISAKKNKIYNKLKCKDRIWDEIKQNLKRIKIKWSSYYLYHPPVLPLFPAWSLAWPKVEVYSAPSDTLALPSPALHHLLHLLLLFAPLSWLTLPHLAPLSFFSEPLKYSFQKMLLFELMNHFSPGVVGWGRGQKGRGRWG